MEKYINEMNSIYYKLGEDIEKTLETIANRYMGQNPPHPFIYRASHKNGFKRMQDYRYQFDLKALYPEAENEQIAYAWAKLWSDQGGEMTFSASAYGPMKVFCNAELVYKSNNQEERNFSVKRNFTVKLESGWNSFVIRFTKTPIGFGGVFGTGAYKNFPLHFLMPSLERDGQEGWIVTGPRWEDMKALPAANASEAETGETWFPRGQWSEQESRKGQLERIFGFRKDSAAVGWSRVRIPGQGKQDCILKGSSTGDLQIYLGGREVYALKTGGSFEQRISAETGPQDVFVKSGCGETGWGFELEIFLENRPLPFTLPLPVKGTREKWLYAGPLAKAAPVDYEALKSGDRLVESEDGITFWQLDMPGAGVRLFLENTLFGKWNYPLGVTLYGLLQTGILLKRPDIVEYIKHHVELCTSGYWYSLWDRLQYGAAGINNQISAVDSLDDCGSFGSTMLELLQHTEVTGARELADDIADYISNQQSRLEEGTLYRKGSHSALMVETLWADDLYMSVPFLCRYYRLTGESRYIDDAARQFLFYKKYLYIPEKKIMSHIYDFRHDAATGVPWGRGNGWVAFSLSELLAVLPEEHQKRDALLAMFNDLAEGYLALQDEEGMWHQVLTDFESYPETSCTSMFAYAFARGVRFGWLKNTEAYARSVFKAWEGISRKSIDKAGNIYGVCRGSGSSFSAGYYKNDLSWLLNDPHGIGIVMLAGIETQKLKEYGF